MFSLHATGIGEGVAVGKARLIRRHDSDIPRYAIEADGVDAEVERLRTAWDATRSELQKKVDGLTEDSPEEVGAFLNVHLTMLDDPAMFDEPEKLVREKLINAESALKTYAKEMAEKFSAFDDRYLAEKITDVRQVLDRVIGELMDDRGDITNQPPGKFDGEIIVSHDLTPADTIELKKHKIAAFITNLGSPTSHTAILARSLHIPAIVGLHGAIDYLQSGETLVIDGANGLVLAEADERALGEYRERHDENRRSQEELAALLDTEAVTLDGHKIALMSNIELPDEVQKSLDNRAEGIGLYRTEFLFMNRKALPDEEEQFEIYRGIVEKAGHQLVTIRTMDVGADKQLPGVTRTLSNETNPALGLRGLRLSLHNLPLFKPQLRAIYRASAFGRTRMMVPMLTSIEEIDQLEGVIQDVCQELKNEGIDHDADMPVGGMIEVPAAAVSADLFAKRLDFLTIGTNDLIQYTLALDRIDDDVNYLYDPMHPSILRLVKTAIDAGREADTPVSMCGEMAGNPQFTRILLGIGLRHFSMDPAAVTRVKRQVQRSDIGSLSECAEKFLRASDPVQQRDLLAEINA